MHRAAKKVAKWYGAWAFTFLTITAIGNFFIVRNMARTTDTKLAGFLPSYMVRPAAQEEPRWVVEEAVAAISSFNMISGHLYC
jgi:hypothetical protein